MSKIEQALTFSTLDFEDDLTAERFISPLRLGLLGRENPIHSMDEPFPWIPSAEELTAQVREDLERQIAVEINFTITPFVENFETELAELDRKDAKHDGPYERFEDDLEDLDWEMTPFEETLAMLDYEDGKTR